MSRTSTLISTISRHSLLLALVCGSISSAPADEPPGYGAMQIQSGAAYGSAVLDAYGTGYASVERATRLDHDAVAARDERNRRAALRDAAQAYEDALAAFEQAVKLEPKMYEAHTYIGYASRKLGRYERSLAAYEAALRLKPDYVRAIEYQGEAFLGLDRFDAAKFNYLRLYAMDSQQAEKLLVAMRAWLEQRRVQPRGVSQDQLASASAWLATRPSTTESAQANESTPW